MFLLWISLKYPFQVEIDMPEKARNFFIMWTSPTYEGHSWGMSAYGKAISIPYRTLQKAPAPDWDHPRWTRRVYSRVSLQNKILEFRLLLFINWYSYFNFCINVLDKALGMKALCTVITRTFSFRRPIFRDDPWPSMVALIIYCSYSALDFVQNLSNERWAPAVFQIK